MNFCEISPLIFGRQDFPYPALRRTPRTHPRVNTPIASGIATKPSLAGTNEVRATLSNSHASKPNALTLSLTISHAELKPHRP